MADQVIALKNEYRNTFRRRRRTLSRRLDNSVMRSNIDPDMFLSEVFQLRDELNDLSEVVSNERFTLIILDVLPEDMYSTIKVQSTRDPHLGLEEIISIIKRSLLTIRRGQFPKRAKSRTVKVMIIAIMSQNEWLRISDGRCNYLP